MKAFLLVATAVVSAGIDLFYVPKCDIFCIRLFPPLQSNLSLSYSCPNVEDRGITPALTGIVQVGLQKRSRESWHVQELQQAEGRAWRRRVSFVS